MRRKLEFLFYTIAILYFIVRYADVDIERDNPRRSVPKAQPPAVLTPDDAPLPRPELGDVVVALDPQAKNSVGTAFAVDSRGTYVTARHVVDGCKQVYLVAGPRQLEPVLSAVSDTHRDFAVLRARALRAQPFALTETSPDRGTNGYMMGYPQGKPADVRATVFGRTFMRSEGRYQAREAVIAWVERERRPLFDGSLGGISGGPVFNEQGYVIGTVVAGAPRRGRVYTTHPQVFRNAGLISDEGKAIQGLRALDFDKSGAALRASRAIAQVYCKVD